MELGASDGVTVLGLAGALALFADARAAAGCQTSEALAAAAGSWVERRLGRPVAVLFARQEHTTLSFCYGAEGALAPGPHLVGVCDALLTAEPGVVLTVRTADCLPVVLAGDGVAAVIHAGWRGLAGDIIGAVVRRVAAEHGVAPARLAAALGTAIGPCHYEVGDDVRAGLARHEVDADGWRHGAAVDLAAWARGRLLALGLAAGRIDALGGCTACSATHHSYRRDGASAGRQWSAVVIPPSE